MTDAWVLAGRYRVDGPIGSGGMGEVWRGYDQQLDRRVAIKLMHRPATPRLRPGSAEELSVAEAAAVDRERFLREIRTTARLDHPGIPAVYDFGVEESSDRIYLVMQLLFGQTLTEMLGGPQPISWSAAIAAQIATTLVEVHRVDVVHRDIKPSNVMVTAGGLVKLLDFGVAVLQGAAALPRLTQVGRTVGSPPYMSREQALGNPVGPPTDVYALGCVLHEMLTGRVPFEESSARSYQDHHINTPASPVRLLRPDVPAALDQLVVAMLAKSPGERPDAERVYETLAPFTVADPGAPTGERDPRRPFLRPMAPTPRAGRAPARPDGPPLTVDEAIDLHTRVQGLIEAGELQPAIDLLEDAVARARHDPELELEIALNLATTLYAADEYSRASVLLDRVVPQLSARDGETDPTVLYLRYAAGVSHAESGEPAAALGYLTEYLGHAEPSDPLYRDAKYQRGLILVAVGQTAAGVAELESLRPLLAAEYGDDSIHVRSLDRRLAHIDREK